MNQPRRKRRNAEEALAFDASYKPNNIRNMKEEILEAIYGTVERLEQKVDELSASPKYAGAETVPASNDTTKLEKSIIAMFGKEEEVRGKISKLRDAIVVFADLIKVELGKNEQRSKLLVDAVKQMRQENDVSSKALQDKLEVMNNSPQKKVVTHRFEPTSKKCSSFHWWLGSISCYLHLGKPHPMARASRLGGGRLEVPCIKNGSSS